MKIVQAARSRAPEVVYGEVPGFVLKGAKFLPRLADALIYNVYRKLKNLFPEALQL